MNIRYRSWSASDMTVCRLLRYVFTCTVRNQAHCIQWRKQDLVSTVKSYIIDLIRLRDIDDVITGGPLPDRHIMIKYGQNETMTFISGSEQQPPAPERYNG